jgi:hypothetical protein
MKILVILSLLYSTTSSAELASEAGNSAEDAVATGDSNVADKYEEALSILKSSSGIDVQAEKSFKDYILEHFMSTSVENTQQVFNWRQYDDVFDRQLPEKALAMRLLKECSNEGDLRCLKLFADIQLYGYYGIAQNASDAFQHYLKLSDKGDSYGNRQAGVMLGAGVGVGRNYPKVH